MQDGRGRAAASRLLAEAHADRDAQKEGTMSRVSLHQQAPEFSLPDFSGTTVALSD